MRITGGVHAGRRLVAPRTGVRPTADRVREALFAMLGAAVDGARVLDLFAGSGAVGLEAWSRGAARVVWVESRRTALAALRRNAATLGIEQPSVRAVDVMTALRRVSGAECFDLVFADPPYAWGAEDRGARGSWPALLRAIREGGWLAPAGVLSIEVDARRPTPRAAGWRDVDRRTYGGTSLVLYTMGDEA